MYKIVPMVLTFTYLVIVKIIRTIAQIFVVFSEKLKFNVKVCYANYGFVFSTFVFSPHLRIVVSEKASINRPKWPKLLVYYLANIWRSVQIDFFRKSVLCKL